jgi:hypothetical protein
LVFVGKLDDLLDLLDVLCLDHIIGHPLRGKAKVPGISAQNFRGIGEVVRSDYLGQLLLYTHAATLHLLHAQRQKRSQRQRASFQSEILDRVYRVHCIAILTESISYPKMPFKVKTATP